MYSLAIETSGREGSIAIGRGDKLLLARDIAQQQRHNVELMPRVDEACREQGIARGELGEVYVSIGPGSFTGLRVAVATAKMMALALEVKLVAVPTVDAVARNAPAPDEQASAPTLAVCANLKRTTMYTRLYQWEDRPHGGNGHGRHGAWIGSSQPTLWTLEQLVDHAPRPLWILGDPVPKHADEVIDAQQDVTLLDAALARARAEHVWRIGRELARRGDYTEALELIPLYVRPPEAVELWNKRHGKKEGHEGT